MKKQISFSVPGVPMPQGSMKPFKTASMKFPVVVAQNREKLIPWRNQVATEASFRWHQELSKEPLELTVVFYFQRPKNHYGSGKNSGKLKPNAPRYPSGKINDLDKLRRAVCDAMEGVVYENDGQFVNGHDYKRYGNPPHTDIRVREV